jgi:outer membrane beta-barrel protein
MESGVWCLFLRLTKGGVSLALSMLSLLSVLSTLMMASSVVLADKQGAHDLVVTETKIKTSLSTDALNTNTLSINASNTAASNDSALSREVLVPEIIRQNLKETDIDAADVEVGVYAGLLSVEDFGVNGVTGVFLAYHATEDFFFVAHYGKADTEESSYEQLSGGVSLLSDDERAYAYYDINIAYRLLPGEAFVGRGLALNTALYFLLGAGNTSFGGDTRFTLNAGVGYQLLLLDFFSLKLDMRDHVLDIDVHGQTERAHHLEFTLGASFYF